MPAIESVQSQTEGLPLRHRVTSLFGGFAMATCVTSLSRPGNLGDVGGADDALLHHLLREHANGRLSTSAWRSARGPGDHQARHRD